VRHRITVDTVARVRAEESQRGVAPIVPNRLARRTERDVRVVELADRQQFDRRNAQRLEIRDFLDHSGERAGLLDAGTRRAREAADVHFVDDGLVERPLERPVAFPVVVRGIDESAAHRRGQVVVGTHGIGALPEALGNAPRIWADEHFVRIESVARRGIRWSIDAKGVVDPRPTPANEHVPKVEGLVLKRIQSNGLSGFDRRRAIEQEERHLGRGFRKEREVDAVGIHRRPERMDGTGLGFKAQGVKHDVSMLREARRGAAHTTSDVGESVRRHHAGAGQSDPARPGGTGEDDRRIPTSDQSGLRRRRRRRPRCRQPPYRRHMGRAGLLPRARRQRRGADRRLVHRLRPATDGRRELGSVDEGQVRGRG
jgi:hypothetical protein